MIMIWNIIKLNKELKEAREEIKRLNDIKKSLELEFNNRSIYSKREVYITNALCNLHKVYIARELTHLSFFKEIDEILKTANNLYK